MTYRTNSNLYQTIHKRYVYYSRETQVVNGNTNKYSVSGIIRACLPNTVRIIPIIRIFPSIRTHVRTQLHIKVESRSVSVTRAGKYYSGGERMTDMFLMWGGRPVGAG